MIGIGALFLLAVTSAQPTFIQEMTPDRVHEAIEHGRSVNQKELTQYPLHSEESWHANFDTPFLRIAQLSAAMRKADKPMGDDDVPADFSAGEVHVYVHARDERDRAPRNVSWVALVEPGEEGHVENVIPPLSSSRYVRRMPVLRQSVAPARVARSVKAVFPLRLFVPGNKVRVSFDDGATETVNLDTTLFAGVR